MPSKPRQALGALLTCLAVIQASAAGAQRKNRLELRYVPLELPGAPAAVLPADLDGDGRQDLAVVVAYTEWDQIGIEGSTEMDEIDGLVEVLTIVPSLMDRRELWIFLARAGGGYEALAPTELDRSILSLEAGPPGLPIVALTDDGVAALGLADATGAMQAVFEPLLADRPVLAGTGNFVSDLGLGHDLDGDGLRDLLFPAPDGAAVYLAAEGGLNGRAAARWQWPSGDDETRNQLTIHYPLPEVADVDGDGLPDLLLRDRDGDWRHIHLLLNTGGGRFAEAVSPLAGTPPGGGGSKTAGGAPDAEEAGASDPGDSVVYFGDLDGDGVAEVVTQEELAADDAGMRREIREAKRPPFRLRLYRTRPDLSMADEPYRVLEVTGYAFEADGDGDVRLPGGFQDLDGDGRRDLVTLTLDFSIMQAVRILATRRISIGLDFHVWCQEANGGFRAVTGLDLSGKFRLDLDDLAIGQLSQFAGDFDADGKADFVQMGRGRDVTIHRGREGCVYPSEPDLLIRLEEEPRDLKLVQVRDLDADRLADLLVIQPQKVEEPGVTPSVRLDLYLSGGGG